MATAEAPAADAPAESPNDVFDILSWFDKTVDSSAGTIVVYYRGFWSNVIKLSYQRYLKDLNALFDDMKVADVSIFGVTAQPQTEADKAEKEWGLKFKLYGDPENRLQAFLKEKGWVDLELTEKSKYPHKMVQPGLIALSKNRDVLFSWAIRSGLTNLYGATGRPNPKDVWEIIKAKLSGSTEKMKEPSYYGVFKL